MNAYTPPKFFLCIVFSLAFLVFVKGCSECHAQIITEGPNKGMTVEQVTQYRLAGVQKLAADAAQKLKDAQAEDASSKLALAGVQSKYDWYVDDDAKAWAYGKAKALEAHNNACQRDVIIYLFALYVAVDAMLAFSPILSKWLATIPYLSFLAVIAPVIVFLAGFSVAYAFGRFTLSYLARFIP